MKQHSRRFLSMGLALIMILGMLAAGFGALAEDAGITFPDAYTADLVVPTLDSDAVDAKVEALINTMTVEEKFSFLGGSGTGMEGNAGALPGVPRLGVPEVKMYDGPAGLLYPEDTTNPPQEQMLAATWNEEMARLYGGIVSAENKEIGGGMMLSAQLDIQRVPQFGRTKDQMGEDPYLLSALADDLVGGMQSEGGIAVLKHFAAFAQNANPGSNTNVEVSEQALHEIYLPGFESAIQNANALGVMSSYNKLYGTFASANTYLLVDVLRGMWNYAYYTITDWGGNDGERSYGTIASMTSPYEALVELLGEDKVVGEVYNDIVGVAIPEENLYTTPDGDEHGAVRTYGTAGSEGTPIVMQGQTFFFGAVDPREMEGHEMDEYAATDATIAFTTGTKNYKNGETGNAFPAADNSAYTWDTYVEAPEDGVYSLIYESMGGSGSMTVKHIAGAEDELGNVSGPNANQGTQYYSSIVPTETGMNVASLDVELKAGNRYHIIITCAQEVSNKDMQVQLAWITPSMKADNEARALKAAAENDTVVVFAYAKVSDPGMDRQSTSLKLDAAQQEMILKVAEAAHAAGNKVVVVLNNDSAVVMEDWIDSVDAILEMYYPGQRGGGATANLLTGKVNPSGKLAFTIPKKDEETILTISDEAWADWLTVDEGGNTTTFREGILTGYRWYDANGIEPQFDFGYGLSYTTFEYSDLSVTFAPYANETAGYDVTFTVTNTGDVAGSEVAQVYLGEAQLPEGLQSAKVQLAGFEKVRDLEPGESREVTIHVNERSLSYWNSNQEELTEREDGTKGKWTVATGARTVYVGAASDNLPLSAEIEVG